MNMAHCEIKYILGKVTVTMQIKQETWNQMVYPTVDGGLGTSINTA